MVRGSVVERAQAVLCDRLRVRRSEIEQAVLTRIRAVAAPTVPPDPEYAERLCTAVSVAVAYSFRAIELGEERAPPPPPPLLSQARLAARMGIGLDIVLRRYFAGHALLDDFLVEEAEQSGLRGSALQRQLRTQTMLFDRLIAAVSEEYTREAECHRASSVERRAERIERLLNGELLNTSEFGYDFEGFHLGTIVFGPGGARVLRNLARSLNCRPLLVHGSEETIWAWLGSQRQTDAAEVVRHLPSGAAVGLSVAVGEPGVGLAGWRLTHKQARAAALIARRASEPVVRYANVALLAGVLQDDLLSLSLRELYLSPLERGRNGGAFARKTLRAYFASGRNVSSAAAALKVNRHTVASRLRAIEERLGCPLDTCAPELEVALRWHDLQDQEVN